MIQLEADNLLASPNIIFKSMASSTCKSSLSAGTLRKTKRSDFTYTLRHRTSTAKWTSFGSVCLRLRRKSHQEARGYHQNPSRKPDQDLHHPKCKHWTHSFSISSLRKSTTRSVKLFFWPSWPSIWSKRKRGTATLWKMSSDKSKEICKLFGESVEQN